MKMKIDNYVQMFTRTFDFKGKSTISEFWIAVLYSLLFSFCAELIALPLIFNFYVFYTTAIAVSSLYEVVVFVPMLALTIRRLHDANHSAWALLWLLIPFVGIIVLIVYLASPSQSSIDVWPFGVIKTAEPQTPQERQKLQEPQTSTENILLNNFNQTTAADTQDAISSVENQEFNQTDLSANGETVESDTKQQTENQTQQVGDNFSKIIEIQDKPSFQEDEPIKVDDSQVIINDTTLSRSQRITKLQEMLEAGQISQEEYHKKVMEILKS